MSIITNLMVSGYLFPDEIHIVQDVLDNVHEKQMPWMRVDGTQVGGSKVLVPEIFIAAMNHLEKEKFVSAIKNLKNLIDKDNFERLQVFVMGDDDDIWSVYLASTFSTQCL